MTRVVRVQARGHLVADAGMTELIRPMLYGARHPVSVLQPGAAGGRTRVDAVGAGVRGGRHPRRGPAARPDVGEGALLAVGEVGAYGLAMASGYNGRLLPAQAVIEAGAVRLSRRRQTLEDVVARDV